MPMEKSSSTQTQDNKNKKKKKKQMKSKMIKNPSSAEESSYSFKPSHEVKGLKFGTQQFIVKSFTIRRASPLELLRLLDLSTSTTSSLPSTTTTFIPTNFTILAHHAWHTLTLGLGTNKSKVVLFVFESETMKASVERAWPAMVALGEVNRRLVRGLNGCEMARFKFRKGCLTFYVYAVRRVGSAGFLRGEDLRRVLEAVVALKDFLDHTAMLALPAQRTITTLHHRCHAAAAANGS